MRAASLRQKNYETNCYKNSIVRLRTEQVHLTVGWPGGSRTAMRSTKVPLWQVTMSGVGPSVDNGASLLENACWENGKKKKPC
ncbi:hypothetical protein CEXT_68021 [Caerostris extrusa]|uniref:Uncharacterized protein n=1 Tax=Caerostris extrusa TaxID=172846 RepID=A0AAV4VRE9_CAEEX|nr:hypothetical protein CEXT_68021 [Caerostris extrusa]